MENIFQDSVVWADEEYSDKVLDHFLSPRNVHTMPDADAEGKYGDPDCGDYLIIFIKVKEQRIDDISYVVFGCPASIATSSMLSELAKGKSIEDALLITDQDVLDGLDGLPEHKQHCSLLAVSALRKAIEAYQNKVNTDESNFGNRLD
jgi:nitrogen fixation NifU-like protein